MKEYYALEIWEEDKHIHARILYRSDLYPSTEKLKEAFLNLDTKEAFTALQDVADALSDVPFNLENEEQDDPGTDDYANAYFDGNSEIVKAVNDLLAWVKGEKKEWLATHWIELGVQKFTAHEEI